MTCRRVLVAFCPWLIVCGWVTQAQSQGDRVDYSRDIRPLFSDNCYLCHGPDAGQRQTEWRLDVRESALGEADSGDLAIVPGSSAESILYQRISADDADERMPPIDCGKQLTPAQIERIKRWIDGGAAWRAHWSFIKPQRFIPPELQHAETVRNPIDRFILARLDKEELTPSPQADKRTLIRRAALDLTGLPPTVAEIDAFMADRSPQAYEKLLDRLFASPRYGEQMARQWLDLARYGDTHGLHLDNKRSIWPYRDWVIAAFNENMPFDQFTVEQLAGDLLPEPTLAQRVATGFNRCNVSTGEGGSIDEECLVRYAVDRTETMGTVWLGLTVGCAVCHDHKYDPISQKEFYQLYAFFNSMSDRPLDKNALLPPPSVRVPTPEQSQRRESYRKQVEAIKKQIEHQRAELAQQNVSAEAGPDAQPPEEYVWIEDALPSGAQAAGDGPWQFVSAPDHPVYSGRRAGTRTAKGRSQHFFTGAKPPLRVGDGDRLFAYVYLDPKNPPREIMLQFNDGSWEHRAFWGEDLIDFGLKDTLSRRSMGPLPKPGQWVRLEVEAARVGLKRGAAVHGWAFTQFGGTVYWDKAGMVTRTPQGGDPLDPLKRQLAGLKKKQGKLEKSLPGTLVSEELPKPRAAFLLQRGQYDKRGEKVTRGVPAVLPPMPDGAPNNRLGLARWLVDPSHPLTARVVVNRLWQRLFGTGIVKTAGNFGSQGEWPSHPKLLDWLATELIRNGWDVRHVQRLIVTSATYRQSSRITAEALRRDPENRLLARGPRFRMDAEMVRDNALAIGGLLVERIGGPSVKPYQPAGLWKAVGYTSSNTANFKQDHGDALYRRSMYTFWKRTSPPPTMSLLDAPTRETCTVRRTRTNTPLAALALLNDVQFFESARALAQRMMRDGGTTAEDRIVFAFRLATARRPTADELTVLHQQFQSHLDKYRQDQDSARKVLGVGESEADSSLDVSELAAWTIVASVILNLDETVTKG